MYGSPCWVLDGNVIHDRSLQILRTLRPAMFRTYLRPLGWTSRPPPLTSALAWTNAGPLFETWTPPAKCEGRPVDGFEFHLPADWANQQPDRMLEAIASIAAYEGRLRSEVADAILADARDGIAFAQDRRSLAPSARRENSTIRAARFACEAHRGVLRKYTGRPYIEHPMRVAGRVVMLPDATEELIAAAHLHDVVEDTEITLDEIEREFGSVVARYVGWLTNVSNKLKKFKKSMSREERKRIDREKIAKAPVEVRRVKLIDRADNVRDIPIGRDTVEFANLYGRESFALLDALQGTDELLELELVEELRRLRDGIRKHVEKERTECR